MSYLLFCYPALECTVSVAGNEAKHATRSQKHEQPAGKAIENTVTRLKDFHEFPTVQSQKRRGIFFSGSIVLYMSLAGEMIGKYFVLFAADAMKGKDFHELSWNRSTPCCFHEFLYKRVRHMIFPTTPMLVLHKYKRKLVDFCVCLTLLYCFADFC